MITCVGVGPGDLAYLTRKGESLITGADVVAGFDSVLNMVAPLINKSATVIRMTYRDQVEQMAKVAEAHHQGKTCVVAFMGDIHFSGFQLLERVESACGHEVETVPGISSAQVLASRARVCFDETSFITFHRRGDIDPFKVHLANALKDGRNAIVIPRPWDFMPHHVAAYLIEHGVECNHEVEVWENLTQRQVQWRGKLDAVPDGFSDMCIMLIRHLAVKPILEHLVETTRA